LFAARYTAILPEAAAINGETRGDGNGDGYLAATEPGLFMGNEITS